MAKKEIPEDEGPSQEWLASYADAMTLLLAFFIMMFAFALIDEEKFDDFKVGVAAALGIPDPATDNTNSILSAGQGVTPEVGFSTVSAETAAEAAELRESLSGEITAEDAEALRALLEFEFSQSGAADAVEVGIDERGVYVRFDGRALFPSGSAQLDQEGLTLLATAADVLGVIENRLEVEGHTDNQPTGSQWPSNWELSSARASRVVRWMAAPGGIPELRLMAVGLSDTRPRETNETPEGRQQNRRVEIVVRIAGISDSGVPVIPTDLDDPTGTADGASPILIDIDDPSAVDEGAGPEGTTADGGVPEGTAPDGAASDGTPAADPADGEAPTDGGTATPGADPAIDPDLSSPITG